MSVLKKLQEDSHGKCGNDPLPWSDMLAGIVLGFITCPPEQRQSFAYGYILATIGMFESLGIDIDSTCNHVLGTVEKVAVLREDGESGGVCIGCAGPMPPQGRMPFYIGICEQCIPKPNSGAGDVEGIVKDLFKRA